MLKVIVTFDYELFFGKNLSSEDDVLFFPTDQLLDLMGKYRLSGTFFADVLSVEAYKRANPSSDYPLKFEAQIREMATRGHAVQLHIHPHWITAQYDFETGQWMIDPKTYRIHAFMKEGIDGRTAKNIIEESIDYLKKTIGEVDKDYKCYAYRAGGYCIQPETELMRLLGKCGIIIDSSVCIGKKLSSVAHQFDYDCEYDELNWEIGPGITELPIGSVNNDLLKRFLPNSGFRNLKKDQAKGEGIIGTTKPSDGKLKRLIKYNKTKREFGLEFMHYKQLMFGLKKYYEKYDCCNSDKYISVICHPKSMDAISMDNMEQFINCVLNNSAWIRFSTLDEMLSSVEKGK